MQNLGSPVESEIAVGQPFGVVGRVVDPVVVGFAPSGGNGAAFGLALGVLDGEGFALCGCEESAGASQVEDLRLPAEDGGDEAGVAGQPAGLGRG
jgi:hypothetical protein